MTGNEQRVYRRVLRRETHASRAVPTVLVVVVLVLALLAVIAGCVWLLWDPSLRQGAPAFLDEAARLAGERPVLIPAAVVSGLLGLVLLLAGVLPGRRAREGRTGARMAVLADDGVVADLTADRVARRIGVPRPQVAVVAGRSRLSVRIVPSSGVAVDTAAAQEAAGDIGSGFGRDTAVRVAVTERGAVS